MIRTVGDRPAFIVHGSCRVAIAVHDAWYLRERARLRRKSAEAHPDSISRSNSAAFRRAWKAYHEWEQEQTAWYAPYGLVPPTPSASSLKASPSLGKQSKAQLIRDYTHARPEADADEICTSLHLAKTYVTSVLRRTLRRGYTLSVTERVRRVLADGRLHASKDFDVPPEALVRTLYRLRRTRMAIATTFFDGKTYYQLHVGGLAKALRESTAAQDG
jgi:hypothetical protein